ncbi:MAG: type IV pilus minor pilin PilX [Thermodesulfovibrionales bacterium]
MNILRNEKGVALLIVMAISVIALAVMSALIYMTTSGTQMSGMQKRYKTALEASKGGAGIVFDYVGRRGSPAFSNSIGFVITASGTCVNDKLNKATAAWDPSCDKTSSITITNSATYDMRFDLGPYTTYSKITDTVEGNSGGIEGLVKTGVVHSNPGEIPVKSVPYLYTVEMDTRNSSNEAERARVSVLYQY